MEIHTTLARTVEYNISMQSTTLKQLSSVNSGQLMSHILTLRKTAKLQAIRRLHKRLLMKNFLGTDGGGIIFCPYAALYKVVVVVVVMWWS